MTTKKDGFLFSQGHQPSLTNNPSSSSSSTASQFSNLNLNHTNRATEAVQNIQSFSNPNFDKHFVSPNYESLKPQTSHRAPSLSPKKYTSLIDEVEKESAKRLRKGGLIEQQVSSSTLSLHIAAYENSIEAPPTTDHLTDSNGTNENLKIKEEKSGLAETWRKTKQFFTGSTSEQDILPRQPEQRNSSSNPETMQFKTSQRLLDLSQYGASSSNQYESAAAYGVNYLPSSSSSPYATRMPPPFQQVSYYSTASSPQSTIGNRTSLSIASGMTARTTSSTGSGKINYVIEELKTTEETYVRELKEIIEYYMKPFEAPENHSQFPPQLRGQSKNIFGNIQTLYKFHGSLSTLFNSTDSIVEICHLIIDRRRDFLSLYRPYCQNKPISEAIRNEHHIESMKFFVECQQRAGHLLPLSSYLLKPIQRVTKYQLLLKELLRYSPDEIRKDVTAALAAMLDLLSQLNADLNQLHISAFAGDLRLLGPLRLQTECFVYPYKRKTHRLSNKPQRRFLFLFDGGVLFCKKRTQPLPYAPEYYEHKMCIPMKDLGFAESSRSASEKFDIWDGTKNDGYAIQPIDEAAKAKWIQRLIKLTTALGHYHHSSNSSSNNKQDQQSFSSSSHNHSTSSSSSRPQSWTSFLPNPNII